MPRKIPSEPRVITKLFNPNLPIRKPLIPPTIIVTKAIVRITATKRGICVISPESTMPVNAKTLPTLKSIPAVKMVNVIPIPKMIGTADERTILLKLEPEKKVGCKIAIAMSNIISRTRMPNQAGSELIVGSLNGFFILKLLSQPIQHQTL
ncbi:unannotated protein [freshwater metagenome]|uniref:Unannotated protein n=1 Tax=freshwater metagenome TaxID=449393 RepID=A0A6J6QQR5_9ZZZZ